MQSVKVEAVRSEINVTPLVDVVLVLLIIFMVVTPMLQRGPAVNLPQASDPPKKPEDKNEFLVTVTKAKDLYLEKEKLAEGQLLSRLQEEFLRNKSATVVVKGDSSLEYGEIKKALLTVKQSGFERVGLISQRQETSTP